MRLSSARVAFVAAAVTGLGHAGCGKVSGAAGDGGVTIDRACGDLAQTVCRKRASCSSAATGVAVNISAVFGDMATCMTRETLQCTSGLTAPMTGNSPTLTEACVAAYPNIACDDFFDDVLPAPCVAAGPATAGAACAFLGQCASSYCADNKTSTCGTCGEPPAVGASCVSTVCDRGQVCVADTQLCQTYGATGATCDTDHPCAAGLFCTGAVASTGVGGTCQTAAAQLGAACGGTMPGCDRLQGLFCGGTVGAKTCMAMSYVADGMPCGGLTTTSFAECLAGACYTTTGLATGTETGTCKADAAEGAACDNVLGPGCMLPARCATSGDGSAGVCTLPVGATCG